jgi:hypothetical protein
LGELIERDTTVAVRQGDVEVHQLED